MMLDEPQAVDAAYCICPLAGMCSKHKVKKSTREWQLCRGMSEGIVPATEQMAIPYRRAWDAQAGVPQAAKRRAVGGGVAGPVAPVGKPGSELKKLLAWFGVHASTDCGCTNHANKMDQLGCDWCETNIETIIGWLQIEASKSKVLGISADMVFGFEAAAKVLVRTAISNARAAVESAVVPAVAKGRLIGIPIDRSKLVTHIIYHVMPLSGDAEWVWRRHIRWLHSVRHQYNGRLIIGIVTKNVKTDKESYCAPSEVMKACEGLDAEFIEVANDRKLGEGKTFTLMLEKLKTDDPNEVVFYGHCKGVSRYQNKSHEPPHLWAATMFDTLFRNRDVAIAALDTKGICGPFRMLGNQPIDKPGVGPHWFFSGTFFAFRSVDAYRRRWKRIPKHYGCVEQWPRLMFDAITESECLAFDNVGNLYEFDYWENKITDDVARWRSENRERVYTAATPSLSVIVPTINRESLVRTLVSVRDNGLHDSDEVIVVVDGDRTEFAERCVTESGITATVVCTGDRSNDWGRTARELGQSLASRDYLLWMDDDDIYADNALLIVRREASDNPGAMFVFQMRDIDGALIRSTQHPKIVVTEVSTQMFVCPRSATLGSWGSSHEGDFEFIHSTISLNPLKSVHYPHEVICIARPIK